MKIVGIIGPYFSGGNRRLIDHNIANAQYVMTAIANYFGESKLVGFFGPHSHTARFEKLAEASEDYYHTLDWTLFDRACDGFILLPEWCNSDGAKNEIEQTVCTKDQPRPLFSLKSYEAADTAHLLNALEAWTRHWIRDHELLFLEPVFHRGLNVTVRNGVKWLKATPDNTLHIKQTDQGGIIYRAQVIGSILVPFKSIPDFLLTYEHDPNCRTREGLLGHGMKPAYPDFTEDNLVTVLLFWI